MSKSFWPISVTVAHCPFLNSTRILRILQTSPYTDHPWSGQVKVANGGRTPGEGEISNLLIALIIILGLYLIVAEGCLFLQTCHNRSPQPGHHSANLPIYRPPYLSLLSQVWLSARPYSIWQYLRNVFSHLPISRIISWHPDTTTSRDACPSLAKYLRCHEDIF